MRTTRAPRFAVATLEQLSSVAGAKLLGALGVKGNEAELRIASDQFGGQCLALTLLGSYLTDAYDGDIRHRKEVSEHLADDVRQGAHARKVMESYQTWLGEGPELSILRMLGSNVLGARGALLSALAYFFEEGRWGSLAEATVAGQSLTSEDRLFVLAQAGLHLMHVRGMSAPEARICYERAEPLCHSLNRPAVLYSVLMGQWYYSLMTAKVSASLQIAKRVYSLAQQQNHARIMLGACNALAVTFYYSGDFESSRQYAMLGVQIWRSRSLPPPVQELVAPDIACLVWKALSEWHFESSTLTKRPWKRRSSWRESSIVWLR